MGEFSGIDPAALKKMITSFDSDRQGLRDFATCYKGEFESAGLDSDALSSLLTICGWMDDESPKLKRRENLAAAMAAGDGPGTPMVQIPEPVTETSAQTNGKKLAQQFNANNGGDSKAGDQYHALAQELLAHQDDPDFCSAFYANLTPAEATTLPTLLASTGSSTAGNDLMVYSHALGTATKAGFPAPGFDKVVSYYTSPLPKGSTSVAWNRAAMLQYGTFPTDFLVKTTRANGLDQFAKDPDQNFSSDPYDSADILGLPKDVVALDLKALSPNEAATQQALAGMGQDPGKTDLNGNLKSLAASAGSQHDPDLTAAFQNTLMAGSGDRSTPGPYGSYYAPLLHTGPETTFATAAMSALSGSHAQQSDYQDFITTTFTTFGRPADATPQQAGNQAATLLRLTETADPNWPATRPAIQSVAAQAKASKDDLDFMKGYYGNGAADLESNLALELHAMDGTHDGTVLSPDSTKILGEFGDNLASATHLNAAGKLPEFDAKTFTEPHDMWSASMLVKYGPSGDKWDHTFLTNMGDAALHWRADQKDNLRPGYVPGNFSMGTVDSWADPSRSPWYKELGLHEDNFTMNIAEQRDIAQGISANDPSLAVMSKLGENPQASRDLLSGGDGRFAADQLVNDNWQTPGVSDDSKFTAQVLLAATRPNGLKGDELAKASTAAANVFQGALDNGDSAANRSAGIKEQYPQLPDQLAEGLAQVAAIYVPDLAQSMNDNAAAKPDPKDLRFTSSIDPTTGLPLITTDYKAIDQLMHQFMPDPRAAGLFEGGMDGYMATAAENQKANPTAAGDTLRQLAMLDGQMQNVREDMQYTPAAKKDEQANKAAMWTWVAGGVLGTVVPGGEEGAVVSNAILQTMSTSIAGTTAWGSYQFPTGNADKVTSQAQADQDTEMRRLEVPIVQGLISSGQVRTPPDSDWIHDGKLDPAAITQDPNGFNTWWTENAKAGTPALDLFGQAKNGYNDATSQRAANSDGAQDGH
ncbi:hypothetical protein SAMN05216223_11424 [Actinacidiphila yanglinensis]|uniref:Uncharacterized protein n=1 Tax=Actinacidiphila yanglinensis TaxID=310779 RepID=A0A1H6DD78_9ACTN|nr:hypothetical protein [Actinacidiphila yanglinensis]SEG83221.1 hypothetical protein SAMN05216223_11424 [Actinacidiphila yanglinensis]